jgi:hypothetical protein
LVAGPEPGSHVGERQHELAHRVTSRSFVHLSRCDHTVSDGSASTPREREKLG